MHRDREEDFLRNEYFHYILWPHPSIRTPACPVGHESYNFNRYFLGHHNYILNLSYLCLGVKKILKGIMHFHYTTYTRPKPVGHGYVFSMAVAIGTIGNG